MNLHKDLTPGTRYHLRVEDCCVQFMYTGIFLGYKYYKDEEGEVHQDQVDALIFENLIVDAFETVITKIEEALYWHELELHEVQELSREGLSWLDVSILYGKPEWCHLPGALSEGEMGCWSLVSQQVESDDEGPCSYCDYNRG